MRMSDQNTETCDNCGSKLGRLEKPQLFDNSIVCPTCYEKLQSARVASNIRRGIVHAGNTPNTEFFDSGRNRSAAGTLFRVLFWIIAAIVIWVLLSRIQWANSFGR